VPPAPAAIPPVSQPTVPTRAPLQGTSSVPVDWSDLRDDDVPVTVEADDPAAGPDIRAWCRMRGHEHAGESRAADGTPAYTVRRLH